MALAIWLAWMAGGYLVLGILTTVLLSQTPYSDNGMIVIAPLWPLFLLEFAWPAAVIGLGLLGAFGWLMW
jgi:hypothetical protein